MIGVLFVHPSLEFIADRILTLIGERERWTIVVKQDDPVLLKAIADGGKVVRV